MASVYTCGLCSYGPHRYFRLADGSTTVLRSHRGTSNSNGRFKLHLTLPAWLDVSAEIDMLRVSVDVVGTNGHRLVDVLEVPRQRTLSCVRACVRACMTACVRA